MSESFPSLRITRERFIPAGTFAETQAEYLNPDPDSIRELDVLLAEKKVGLVAHFYMDPELQGTLSACEHPHVHVSDSLAMADAAIGMVEKGCEHIVVLGVDFMSENARAMLDAAGHREVPVYRVAAEPIGCSLAESAEGPEYEAWLRSASAVERSLHVVYINTSLRTKAKSHAIVPTITCTSSNVLSTILTAYAQIPDLHVWYGPDTYMGMNLEALLRSMSQLDDDAIRQVHPDHDRASVASLLARFHYYEHGNCVVHHMFGNDVARRVRHDYRDAFVTAHLEVPSAMFDVALEAQRDDRGVVGSTSNILSFIERKVREVARSGVQTRPRFILGTEAGMITSIVRAVRRVLSELPDTSIEPEIIFPVASDAVTTTDDPELALVPGAATGEGCSVEGGCATCPFMKMNSLDALLAVVRRVRVADDDLVPYFPQKYTEMIQGRTAADLGGEPIVHMREFSRHGKLPQALVQDVVQRSTARTPVTRA